MDGRDKPGHDEYTKFDDMFWAARVELLEPKIDLVRNFSNAIAGKPIMRVKGSEYISVVVAVIACAGAVVSALYSYSNRNRELDIELIKIGIGILRADPKETQTKGARAWAIQVIETYSRHPFSAEAKTQLLDDKLGYDDGIYAGSFGDDYSFDGKLKQQKK